MKTAVQRGRDPNSANRENSERTPMNRFGEAQELLGTPPVSGLQRGFGFVNGVVIPVDGGFSAYSGV